METLALLKLLALGRKEVLAGQIKPMAEAFTAIDARIATGRKARSKCSTESSMGGVMCRLFCGSDSCADQ